MHVQARKFSGQLSSGTIATCLAYYIRKPAVTELRNKKYVCPVRDDVTKLSAG